MPDQVIIEKLLNRIYGHGMGWTFSAKDFADLATLDTINKSLQRLQKKGTIRRILRGIYDYPQFSSYLNEVSPPNMDAIALAISRIHGWTICASGNTALNLLGLSPQVPAIWEYLSDGPSKTYSWSGGKIHFLHRTNKEITVLSSRTALVVQGLKALGESRFDNEVMNKLKTILSFEERKQAFQEARYSTSWIYEAIKRIAKEKGASDA